MTPLLALLVLLVAPAQAPARAATRPNILLILADDWSWPHASVYGDPAIQTPNFDRVAASGMLFSQAYAISPLCSPSRAALLTGQAPHRLDEAANLYGTFPARFQTYVDLLESAGYRVAYSGKGWSPGEWKAAGRSRNPAGPSVARPYIALRKFLAQKSTAPFCFWMGAHEPHRPYVFPRGTRPTPPPGLRVPAFLPDTPRVRQDLAEYYAMAARFDAGIGETLAALEDAGVADNTLIVVTSDNGMPFPRAKGNVYDPGTRVPLAVLWPGHVRPGTRTDAFVDLSDLAPTFLEAAGVTVPAQMTARSLVGLLEGAPAQDRDHVFLERERHVDSRAGHKSYPMRAVRTAEYLYIRNLRPELWPAGDPDTYDDIDNVSGSKVEVLSLWKKKHDRLAGLSLEKRPAEELYDLRKDPDELTNVASHESYGSAKARLRAELDAWMRATADPRVHGDDTRWDDYPYLDARPRPAPKQARPR